MTAREQKETGGDLGITRSGCLSSSGFPTLGREIARVVAGVVFLATPVAMLVTAGTGWFFVVWLGGGLIGGALAAYVEEGFSA